MNVQSMCSGDAALVPGGLRGYRMWNARGALLTAVSHSVDWTLPTQTAACAAVDPLRAWLTNRYSLDADTPQPHAVPDEKCTCGIYGWYRPAEARLHRGDVFGVVEATGRVLLGDFGFRAERARIVALVSDYEPTQHYWTHRGVPVFEDRERLLAEFPPQDVRELIGREIPDTPPDPEWGSVWGTVSLSVNAQTMSAIMRQFGLNVPQTLSATRRTTKAIKEVLDALPEDPAERALALRRQGTRGPVRKRPGRARQYP